MVDLEMKKSNFEKIFFYIIEFYYAVILLLESRETVYTTLRKVVSSPKASPSKLGPKPFIYYRESYSMMFWCFYEHKFSKNHEKVGKLNFCCSKHSQYACYRFLSLLSSIMSVSYDPRPIPERLRHSTVVYSMILLWSTSWR